MFATVFSVRIFFSYRLHNKQAFVLVQIDHIMAQKDYYMQLYHHIKVLFSF